MYPVLANFDFAPPLPAVVTEFLISQILFFFCPHMIEYQNLPIFRNSSLLLSFFLKNS